jgi:hypothetical protein
VSISQASTAEANGTSLATLAVVPVAVGNFLLFGVKISSGTFTVSSVAGGGVTTWTKILGATDATNAGREEIWGGVVTATGSATVTATYSASPGVNCDLWASELHWSGGTPTWVSTASNSKINASSTTITWPTLTSAASGGDQAYWGFERAQAATVTAGSTSGFTYSAVSTANGLAVFNGTLAVSTGYAPTATNSVAHWSFAIGVIMQAQPAGGTATPAVLALTVVEPAATASGGATTAPAVEVLTVTEPTATARGGGTASPSVEVLTVTEPAATGSGGAITTPAVEALVVTEPAATATGGATATPAVEALTVTEPASAGSGGAVASPAVEALTVTEPAATATGSSPNGTATPAAEVLAVVPLVATASGGASTSPAVEALTFVLPAATATGGGGATPAVEALAFVLPAPTVTGQQNATATPATLALTFVVYAPFATGGSGAAAVAGVSPHPLFFTRAQRTGFIVGR